MIVKDIVNSTRLYNLHSHTEFCDGKAPMTIMASAAERAGFKHYAFTPHSPTGVSSPCNMKEEDVANYLSESNRLKKEYAGRMNIYTGMEIDYIDNACGPHSRYYQTLPLDLRIGSVHFVPNQRGEYVDCDGSAERFQRYLHERFSDDLRYIVEKYYSQVAEMLIHGGFDILGHFDKIAGNAGSVDAMLEESSWYEDIVEQLIAEIVKSGVAVEINTKAYGRVGRFFPSEKWWSQLARSGVTFVVNSDAHHPDLVTAGRDEAFALLDKLEIH